MSEQFDPRMDEIARALAAITAPTSETMRAFQTLNQALIETFQSIYAALLPVVEAFGAWYVSLSPELQAALSGRPLNRRRVVRAQKMRRYARTLPKPIVLDIAIGYAYTLHSIVLR